MALGLLISLGFWSGWLAEVSRQFAENINYSNHIHGSEGRAFPLPSSSSFSLAVQLSSITTRPKTMMDGANGTDIIGEFSKSASR